MARKPKKAPPAQPAKRKAGRPTKYKPEFVGMARKASSMGATTQDLAELFGVAVSTVDKWLAEIPVFSEAVKKAKQDRDQLVERSLFERATGYSHAEDKIFNDDGTPLIVPTIKHYPPDPVSMIFWLKNRQPDKWRDKSQVDVTVKDDVAKRILEGRKRARAGK